MTRTPEPSSNLRQSRQSIPAIFYFLIVLVAAAAWLPSPCDAGGKLAPKPIVKPVRPDPHQSPWYRPVPDVGLGAGRSNDRFECVTCDEVRPPPWPTLQPSVDRNSPLKIEHTPDGRTVITFAHPARSSTDALAAKLAVAKPSDPIARALYAQGVTDILRANLAAEGVNPLGIGGESVANAYQREVTALLLPALRTLTPRELVEIAARGGLDDPYAVTVAAQRLAEQVAAKTSPAVAEVEVYTGKVTIKKKFRFAGIEFSFPSFDLFKVAAAAASSAVSLFVACAFSGCEQAIGDRLEGIYRNIAEHAQSRMPADLASVAEPAPAGANWVAFPGLSDAEGLPPFRLMLPNAMTDAPDRYSDSK